MRTSGEKKCGGVLDTDQALLCHLEKCKFAGGTEAVLRGAEHTERRGAVPLEIKHRIDHVLDDTGTGDRTVLRHMTDQNDRNIQGFCDAQKSGCDLAGLGNRARCGGDLLTIECLDRVDDA